METSIEAIRDRVTSVCAGAPFGFVTTEMPFDFKLQPSGAIDTAFRITTDQGTIVGGTNYSETVTDPVVIWLARKHTAAPEATYRQLLTDARSLRAAIIHDGVTGGGDYDVPDGGAGATIQNESGREYAVLRLTVPVNYERTV